MNITITPRLTHNKKNFYTIEWGKKAGQRIATGIFSYVNPENQIQEQHNKEALDILEIKKSKLILEWQAVGTGSQPCHKYKNNFLEFYEEYVKKNKGDGNRHLECSLIHFKKFVKNKYISPLDITEDCCERFRKYLLDHLNGETPANYFTRFKKVLKSATRQGYFKINPTQDISAKANKNKRRKNNLEADEYIQLLRTPCLNEEVSEAFILCCYTGLRWCDVRALDWGYVRSDSIVFNIVQEKTFVEHFITLHPIAKAILDKRNAQAEANKKSRFIFDLPTADGANKALGLWCKNAGIKKHITWNCARSSFSILLQDERVDAAHCCFNVRAYFFKVC